MAQVAIKNAAFAAIAAPSIESAVNFMSAAHAPTRTNAPAHCPKVPARGLPRDVRQADEVCISGSVTAQGAIMRTRPMRISLSPPATEGKISLVKRGAKIYSPAAMGREKRAVINSEEKALFFAPFISPSAARGEMRGTLAAASP